MATEYETIKIRKVEELCSTCEIYVEQQTGKPIAVICCDGACLRGEIARRAANLLCNSLKPEQTVRICLGAAFTEDIGGQRRLVKNGKRVIAVEGCFIECASRMMQGVIPELKPEIVIADELYDLTPDRYGIHEGTETEINDHARTVAEKIAQKI